MSQLSTTCPNQYMKLAHVLLLHVDLQSRRTRWSYMGADGDPRLWGRMWTSSIFFLLLHVYVKSHQEKRTTSTVCENQTKTSHSIQWEEVKGPGPGVSRQQGYRLSSHTITCCHETKVIFFGHVTALSQLHGSRVALCPGRCGLKHYSPQQSNEMELCVLSWLWSLWWSVCTRSVWAAQCVHTNPEPFVLFYCAYFLIAMVSDGPG